MMRARVCHFEVKTGCRGPHELARHHWNRRQLFGQLAPSDSLSGELKIITITSTTTIGNEVALLCTKSLYERKGIRK